jgi:hypothetical protein
MLADIHGTYTEYWPHINYIYLQGRVLLALETEYSSVNEIIQRHVQ